MRSRSYSFQNQFHLLLNLPVRFSFGFYGSLHRKSGHLQSFQQTQWILINYIILYFIFIYILII
jgi:hypothetical protein